MAIKSWLIMVTSFFASSAYASTQAHLIQIVVQAPTATSIQLPAGPKVAAASIPLTIDVNSSNGLIIADGTVTVSDNSTVIGQVPVANGAAGISLVLGTLGGHQLIACYSGDNNFSPSCSIPVTANLLPPYTLQPTQASAAILNATPFVDKLSIVPVKGFIGVVQLACQVPVDRCSLSRSAVSFSGDGKPETIEVSFIPPATTPVATFIFLPLIGIGGLCIRNKPFRSRLLIICVTVTLLLSLVGCGPDVAFPFDSSNVAMSVNANTGAFSQAVMYQIQVNTEVDNQK
jgi:Bacterial Ig-like domain (group 3)